MMEENNKKKRRAYLNDFKVNTRGDYEYQGIQYVFDGSKEEYKKQMRVVWGHAVLMILCVIGAGCLPVSSMINCVYVILPFTVTFICGVSVIWGLCRLSSNGTSLRSYVYDATVEQVPMRAVGTIVGAAATAAGEIIYLIQNGFGQDGMTAALFLLFLIGAAVLLVRMRKQMLAMKWKRGA